MPKKVTFLVFILMMVMSVAIINAQDDTTTTTTAPQSNVSFFLVTCEDRAVVNFNGTMQAGYSIYYQVVSSGNALTPVIRLDVSGDYAASQVVNYSNGAKVPAGGTANINVQIASTGNSANVIYEDGASDIQDGCAEPNNPTVDGSDVGGTIGGGSGEITNPDGSPVRANSIYSPFGGFLNPDYVPKPEDVVVIGARDYTPPRQSTPGLIFAECNDYPVANPGLIYDTDNVVLFWSWYASTPELVQDHINNAVYEVGYFDSNPFISPVIISDVEQRGRNYWVFYTINLGQVVPGSYPIEYKVSWQNAISDGYAEFGPGTANEQLVSNCEFTVEPNLQGTTVNYTFP